MTAKETPIQSFQRSLEQTARLAARAFEAGAMNLIRTEYQDQATGAHRSGGSVYAFFDASGRCLYVGESGMPLAKREKKYPSPLADEPWWKSWNRVLVYSEDTRAQRELFERLLVLANSPKYRRHR